MRKAGTSEGIGSSVLELSVKFEWDYHSVRNWKPRTLPFLHLPRPVTESCTFHFITRHTCLHHPSSSLPLPWFRLSSSLTQALAVTAALSTHLPYSCQWHLRCKSKGVTSLFKIPRWLSIAFWVKSRFLNMAYMAHCDQTPATPPHIPGYYYP